MYFGSHDDELMDSEVDAKRFKATSEWKIHRMGTDYYADGRTTMPAYGGAYIKMADGTVISGSKELEFGDTEPIMADSALSLSGTATVAAVLASFAF